MSLDSFLSMTRPLFDACAWIRMISIASFTLESLDASQTANGISMNYRSVLLSIPQPDAITFFKLS